MFPGRWFRRVLPAGVVLTLTFLAAVPAPAAAAAPCTGITCVRTYADITLAATVDPAEPVLGGVIHSYTVQVTNTGWRVGGTHAPMPWIGPASGPVYVSLRQAPYELPMFFTNDSGETFDCFLFNTGIVCHVESLPTNTTSQFTFYYQTPTTPGTYQFGIWANSYKWTEYDETNNSVTLTYAIG
jgi:hypothetical protein